MLVDASLIRNNPVFTNDDKKIGTVINIILAITSKVPRASLLVFPSEKNWLEGYLKRHWGRLTIETIKKAFPAEIPEIIDDIKNKGSEEAEKIWNEYSKSNIEKSQMELKKCYFIPSLAIDESKSNNEKVYLKINLERVENQYSWIGEPPVSADKHMSFFSTTNKAFRDVDSLLPVTLNLPSLQGFDSQDCNECIGTIDDIQLDFNQNAVVNLVIQTSGDNAANRLVSTNDFDFSTFSCSKCFSSYAELLFA